MHLHSPLIVMIWFCEVKSKKRWECLVWLTLLLLGGIGTARSPIISRSCIIFKFTYLLSDFCQNPTLTQLDSTQLNSK